MTTNPFSRILVVCGFALALVAGGCGDDGDTVAEPETGAGADTQPASDGDSVPPDDGDAPDDGATGGGTGTAAVTVGGESFEFDQELVCIALGGAVSGSFSDGAGVQVEIDVPPEDWETSTTGDWEAPSITLRDERDEMNWRIFEAGPELVGLYPDTEADTAQITNFSVDGAQATGNGFAIDTWAIALANVEGNPVPDPVPVNFGFECS